MKCNFCIYVPSRAKLAKRTQITSEYPYDHGRFVTAEKVEVSEVQLFLTETSSRAGDRHFFFRDYCYAVTYLS